jgi:hypothetical protein
LGSSSALLGGKYMIVEMKLAGFFFFFIILTNIVSDRLGHETFNDLNAEAKLKKINQYPKKFKIGVVIALLEHLGIILVAIMLFLAFHPFNMILAVAWTVFRTAEGIIQIFHKREYWRLLDLVKRYDISGEVEKPGVIAQGQQVLREKNRIFNMAQIFFSLGTLSYSILFVTSGAVPAIIGWFGIGAALLYGMGNGIVLVKPGSKILWNVGGLLVLLFEITLGGWLLFLAG